MKLLNAGLFLVVFLAAVSAYGQATIYVSPRGDDKNDGKTAKMPLRTIQHALDLARPGTVIRLEQGIYRETLTTKISGTEAAPIVVRGDDAAKVKAKRSKTVLYGTGRILNIDHSYYRFEGFAIDGQEALAGKEYPTDPAKVTAFKDANREVIKDSKLIYIGSDDATRNLTGIKITNMYLRGAGGECVRLRNAAHHNEVSDSVIEYCGMFAKDRGSDSFRYHNGEAIYIGTSPKSTNQPMYANDTSNNNIARRNVINTYGSECFNVKENANRNVFAGNECRYNLEPAEFSGSNVEIRGDNNVIEGNVISESAGANIKLKSDSSEYDKGGNIIRGNTLSHAQKLNISSEHKGTTICGNKLDGETQRGTTREAASRPCGKN